MAATSGKSPAKKGNQDLAQINFAADAGAGLEEADKDSFAIPFITVLQALSPQVTEETVEGAKAGKLINTVTNELADEMLVVPVSFRRRYLRWVPRKAGGGFKGEMKVSEVEKLVANDEAEQSDEGMFYLYEGDELKDTRMHYVLVQGKDGGWMPAMLSLGSTQIKKSKRWLSMINSIKMDGPDGKFTPPSFSHVYRVTTTKESNDEGTWYGVDFAMVGPVEDPDLYRAAKEFHAQVAEDKVKVDHAAMAGEEESEGF